MFGAPQTFVSRRRASFWFPPASDWLSMGGTIHAIRYTRGVAGRFTIGRGVLFCLLFSLQLCILGRCGWLRRGRPWDKPMSRRVLPLLGLGWWLRGLGVVNRNINYDIMSTPLVVSPAWSGRHFIPYHVRIH